MRQPEPFSPVRFLGDALEILDQTSLPHLETWLQCTRVAEVAEAIRRLSVRGAPALGVTAAYGLALAIHDAPDRELEARFDEAFETLAATRPTAVNLRWALEEGRRVFASARRQARSPAAALADWARELEAADVAANRAMGEHGATLFSTGDRVLTHCNTGSLATAGYGTALGVLTSAWRQGKLDQVWVDETRPLLQGARLTTWELQRLGIPYRLVTDSSAGLLMSRGLVDKVVVGADRIAANGDTANKIGTYGVAVLAHRHGLPFYVAAPLATIDPATASGNEIPIEERDGEEVTAISGTSMAPVGAEATNFAFDITPAELITAIITEAGVLEPPFEASIARTLAAADGCERTLGPQTRS